MHLHKHCGNRARWQLLRVPAVEIPRPPPELACPPGFAVRHGCIEHNRITGFAITESFHAYPQPGFRSRAAPRSVNKMLVLPVPATFQPLYAFRCQHALFDIHGFPGSSGQPTATGLDVLKTQQGFCNTSTTAMRQSALHFGCGCLRQQRQSHVSALFPKIPNALFRTYPG